MAKLLFDKILPILNGNFNRVYRFPFGSMHHAAKCKNNISGNKTRDGVERVLALQDGQTSYHCPNLPIGFVLQYF
jgi:hypothetical protein